MKMRSRAETISFGTLDILDVCVFEPDEVLSFTSRNVANLEVNMEEVLEHEAEVNA